MRKHFSTNLNKKVASKTEKLTQNAEKMTPKVQRWAKFENFNYPLPASNEFFGDLRIFFSSLTDTFIKINNISKNSGEADVVKMLLDQNYSIFG